MWLETTSVSDFNDKTHIWVIRLRQSPSYQAQLFSWLSNREKNKAQRMLINLKRDYQIQARAWLRWLLAQYTGTTPSKIVYGYGSLGKPYLESNQAQIFFNATDSGSTLLCAFSKKNEMGIDIESTPRDVNFQKIAEKKFTKQEQALIESAPQSMRSDVFLALWTRKESFGKALGVGIRYRMNQFNLCNEHGSYNYQLIDHSGRDWSLFQFAYKNNIACLTSTQTNENIDFYKLDIDSLSFQHE